MARDLKGRKIEYNEETHRLCPYCSSRILKRHMKYTFLECVGFYEAMDDAITNIHLKHNHLPFLKHFEKEGQEFDEDGWCKCQECQECKSIEGRYN